MKLSELKTGPVVASGNGGAKASPAPAKDEPFGVVRSTTPSGIEIYYQAGPKRLYRVKPYLPARVAKRPYSETDPQWSEEFSVGAWQEVPSPSGVLEVLEKGGLSWWGMKVGIEGVCRLYARADQGTEQERFAVLDDLGNVNVDGLVDRLKAEKLTVNHVKGAAADRGTNVHTALESWAETGVLPDPQFYPDSEAGYVKGLVQFLRDTEPEVEHSELLVASTEYGYAGRFDMVAVLNGTKYASRCFPKNPSRMDTLQPGGRWLLDLKTSKGVYPSYHLQLAAYEGAMVESGYGQVDQTAVVRVTADGKYELVPGVALQEEFAAVMEVQKAIQRIEKAAKAK